MTLEADRRVREGSVDESATNMLVGPMSRTFCSIRRVSTLPYLLSLTVHLGNCQRRRHESNAGYHAARVSRPGKQHTLARPPSAQTVALMMLRSQSCSFVVRRHWFLTLPPSHLRHRSVSSPSSPTQRTRRLRLAMMTPRSRSLDFRP